MSISVTIAMYCLIQLYMPVSQQLAPHKPILKLFAVKAVGTLICRSLRTRRSPCIPVFLTFWQATMISLLETFNVIKDVSLSRQNPVL